MSRTSKVFVAAGLVNVLAILGLLALGQSRYVAELDPAVFSWLGQVSIVLWGLAYIAVSRAWAKVPWLLAVFFVEKLVYFGAWLAWVLAPTVPLAQVADHSAIIGIFMGGYGLIDLSFGLFFLWAFRQARMSGG